LVSRANTESRKDCQSENCAFHIDTSSLRVVIDLPSTEMCYPIYSDFDIINSWREHIEMISSLVETAMRLCGQPAAREER
jgi:hypothetical protein